ncbi:hypothetical protein [Streptomyces sp. PTY087I2]|uniref:hypothetical protein n=1 Tax=Streptomyces sp. PTY087I2 TaxID=1819298 RepID=UPI00080BF511|nr:hypothetical protein [Streptomyces sp. PTY087I2]OCC08973.1 hypothetical protein A3Q37_04994 [Streptomyces sp. PTY087I2]
MFKIKERLRSLEIPTRVRAVSENQQFGIATILGLLVPVLMFVGVATGSRVWLMVQLPVGVLLTLPTLWLLRPWYDNLPERSQRRFTAAPLIYYVVLVMLFAWLALITAPSDRGWAATLLLLVWGLQFVYGTGVEPNNFALERLRGRLARAAPVRVFTIWCGLIGVLWFMEHTQDDPKFRPVLLGATLTLGAAGAAATLKVFARVRKISTALHLRTQDMIRSLEELRHSSDDDRQDKQAASRRTWDALEATLLTRVDTGFHLVGSFVLPTAAIKKLERCVLLAVDAPSHDQALHQLAIDDLQVMRAACRGRIDVLA